jgi:PPM family protein phosphatase
VPAADFRPPLAERTLNIGFKTDPGRAKPTNEDSILVEESLGLFAVADGMGGHNAGEVASHIAVDRIADFVGEGLRSAKSRRKLIADAISRANEAIFLAGSSDPWWSDMGTTIVAAILEGNSLLIAHVGDSRGYLIRGERIRRLTEDHTFVAEWVRDGSITPEEARTHAARHGLTMALGIEEDVEPAVAEWEWRKADRLLLCSDGLTDVLEDQEILDIVAGASDPAEATEQLVAEANKRGGPDNISVILLGN